MGRAAPDDGAEQHHPGVLAAAGHLQGHLGQFEGPRHADEIDLGLAAAVADDAVRGPAYQPVHDEFIET